MPHRPDARWPLQGWLGLTLVAVCWPLNWLLPGLRTHNLFFPLWLGYILTVDAMVYRRDGSSLLTRSPTRFVLLFLASIPGWWLFELLNLRLGNWVYSGHESFGRLEYFLRSSISYSTVIPAVFETAELLHGLRWVDRFEARRRVAVTSSSRWMLFASGALMLSLMIVWPRYFFPFAWLSLLFLLEPTCHWLGRHSLLGHLESGDWRPVVTLAGGALVCGFFWELWNVYSYPKWTYDIPFVGFWRLFEMPALGYLGYLPFGLELYPLAHLLLKSPPDLRLGVLATPEPRRDGRTAASSSA